MDAFVTTCSILDCKILLRKKKKNSDTQKQSKPKYTELQKYWACQGLKKLRGLMDLNNLKRTTHLIVYDTLILSL